MTKNVWSRGLWGGLVSFAAAMGIALVAQQSTGVPEGFPPFTVGPVAAACFGSAVLGSGVFLLLRRLTRRPERWMWWISAVVIAGSLALPYRLGYTQSKRFAGATPAAQSVLVLLHLIVGGTVTTALTMRPRMAKA
jgi:hypothetical protein